MAISFVLADDHPLVLEALDALLRKEEDFKVVALCRTGEEALSAVRKHKPDILVLDIRMPGKSGIEVLQEMKKEQISTRTVVLTAEIKDDQVTEAVRLGARGLVLKNLASKLVVQCVRDVLAGKLWLERHSATRTLENVVHSDTRRREAARLLTDRELEIVGHVAAGLHNAEIAKMLYISEGTVKAHLHGIYQKLNVDSRVKLSRYAHENGLT